jgi:hypothetical protein
MSATINSAMPTTLLILTDRNAEKKLRYLRKYCTKAGDRQKE